MMDMLVTVYKVDPDNPAMKIAEQLTLKEAIERAHNCADELKQIEELTDE